MISFEEWARYDDMANNRFLEETPDFSSACFFQSITYADAEDYRKLLEDLSDETLIKLYGQCIIQEDIFELINEELKKRGIEPHKTNNRCFADLMFDEMDKRGYKKDPDFYSYLDMSRQTFGKIKNMKKTGYMLGRGTAILIIVALRVDVKKANEMMASVGLRFNESVLRERVIYDKIKSGNYTLEEIEELLYMLGLEPLRAGK